MIKFRMMLKNFYLGPSLYEKFSQGPIVSIIIYFMWKTWLDAQVRLHEYIISNF